MLENQIIWFVIHCFFVATLFLVILLGDFLFQHAEVPFDAALFDNLTHGAIGGLSWLLICLNYKSKELTPTQFYEVLLCSVIASAIDLDHFYAAKSFSLKDVHRLHTRPPLHSSTFPLFTSLLLLYIAYVEKIEWMFKLSFIVLTAFASHHIRDGTRRGLWFYPFGSTKPIPYSCYVGLTIVFPYCASLMMNLLDNFDDGLKLGPNDVLIQVSLL